MVLEKEKIMEMYRKMILIRFMEDKHEALLAEGKFQLMGHFGTGQEAIAVGITAPLEKKDYMFGTHRGAGEYLGKGMNPKDIWAEYFGKPAGLCHGKATLHLGDKNLNIPPVVSSLGSDFSISVGTALASKMQNTGQVTMFYVGEGTFNQADAGPALNMSSIWKLPIVFAVATNQFCELSYYTEYYPTKDVAVRAIGYDIPYEIVDGNDIETTYEVSKKAIEHARSGKGPFLIEFKTFRMKLHYSGDPGGYVKQEDLDEWAKRDPIDLCQKKLLEMGYMTAEEDKKLREEVTAEVEESVEYGFACPEPTIEDLYKDVYDKEGLV